MHAADVTQSAMCMIAYDGLSEGLTDLELLCIIISCCIHDVGHYGVNNDFLVKTQHEWALIYNDTSVNENMHVRVAFEVLQEPECNIFEGMPGQQLLLKDNVVFFLIACLQGSRSKITDL